MQRSEPRSATGKHGVDGPAPNGARPFDSGIVAGDAVVAVGDLAIDRDRYTVTLRGAPLELTSTEFHALWALARRDGRVVAPDQLAEELWGNVPARARRRVAVTISRLRSKLGPAGAAYVRTVHRVGYRLSPPS